MKVCNDFLDHYDVVVVAFKWSAIARIPQMAVSGAPISAGRKLTMNVNPPITKPAMMIHVWELEKTVFNKFNICFFLNNNTSLERWGMRGRKMTDRDIIILFWAVEKW